MHSTASGQDLPQSGRFVCGQHGMSPAATMAAPEAIAGEGAINDPEIIPRTASAHRVLTSADHNAMTDLCLIGLAMTRNHNHPYDHDLMNGQFSVVWVR